MPSYGLKPVLFKHWDEPAQSCSSIRGGPHPKFHRVPAAFYLLLGDLPTSIWSMDLHAYGFPADLPRLFDIL